MDEIIQAGDFAIWKKRFADCLASYGLQTHKLYEPEFYFTIGIASQQAAFCEYSFQYYGQKLTLEAPALPAGAHSH